MACALRGASHFPPLAGAQGSGPEAESRPGREGEREGGPRTPPLPLRGDPGSARVRARAPLAPPIVVQQVELVSRGATCWKGREAPCGGGGGGKSESDPVRPGPRLGSRIQPEGAGHAWEGPCGVCGAAGPAGSLPSLDTLLPVGERRNRAPDRRPLPTPTCTDILKQPGFSGIPVKKSLLLRALSFSTWEPAGRRRGAGRGRTPPPPRRAGRRPSGDAKAAAGTGWSARRRLPARGSGPSPRGAVTRGEGRWALGASTPLLPLRRRGWWWVGWGGGAELMACRPLPLPPGALT